MTTVYVYGFRDTNRFAGFPDFDSFVLYLESQFGSGSGELHDSMDPVGEPEYEVDPALATLMASPEFHKLAQSVKAEILKDQDLVEAFASFLNSGGTFVIDNSSQFATWQGGPPPIITLPDTFLNPSSSDIDRAIFALAHEIYHDKFQTLQPGHTALQWAHNEAIATLEAYRATERMGLYLDGDNFGLRQGAAISLIRSSSSDAEAIQKLEEFYEPLMPTGP